jgi:hypothetical protein
MIFAIDNICESHFFLDNGSCLWFVNAKSINERGGHSEHKRVDQRLLLLELLFPIGLPVAREELAPVK